MIDHNHCQDLEARIRDTGFALVEDVIDPELATQLGKVVMECVLKEAQIRGTTQYEDYGRIFFGPIHGGVFLNALAHEALMGPFDTIIGSNSILYTMTSSCIPPEGNNHTSRIHRDTSIHIPGFLHMVGAMVFLDDLTPDNGAPLFMPFSQTCPDQPDKTSFQEQAVQVIGNAGSVIYFDSRTWHRSTTNRSQNWRRSLLIGMIHPWMKQRFDIPALMRDVDLTKQPDPVLRRLGLFAVPPDSIEEYQAPTTRRFK